MKSSVSESKPFQSRSKGEIPGRARRKERLSRSKLKQAFLIDSDAELFMYLIQCIRLGSWKVRRLSRALTSLEKWLCGQMTFQTINSTTFWQFFLELNSKRLFRSSRKQKESRRLVFTFSTKREMRYFDVVVDRAEKLKKCAKSLIHVQSSCFANLRAC